MTRCVIVDDEPLMRLSIVDALEAVGHDVCAAATGTEGIEEARRREYDLVITDLRLPGAEGLGVLKAAKEARGQRELVSRRGPAQLAPWIGETERPRIPVWVPRPGGCRCASGVRRSVVSRRSDPGMLP